MAKIDAQRRADVTPPIMSGEFVPVVSVLQITHLAVVGPYEGDFQITNAGRLIVGDDPDAGPRTILSKDGIRGWNSNNANTFAIWGRNLVEPNGTTHAPGDMHLGNLAANYLKYDQATGTLGLYTPAGAGFIVQLDGTLQTGLATGAHLLWNASQEALQIKHGNDVKVNIAATGEATFDGTIYADGGRVYGLMVVDDVLRAGDVDGPAVYLGRFTREATGGGAVETAEIIATNEQNLPWFHVVAGGETLPGYFHLGGTGQYENHLSYDGETLELDGTLVSAGGRFRVDSTGVQFQENPNTYWKLKPQSAYFMELASDQGETYNTLRVNEISGIAGYFTGGYIGLYARSTTQQIGIFGYAGDPPAVAGAIPAIDTLDPDMKDGIVSLEAGVSIYGLTEGGTAARFMAVGGGRALVAKTDDAGANAATLSNTGGASALVIEDGLADFADGLIVNNSGSATGDLRVEGDTDTHLIFADASADFVGISESAPNATLDVNGTTRLGDSDTNYLAVGATGLLTLHGSARYERHIQIDAKVDGSPANAPAAVDFFTAGGLQFNASQAKFAFCQWEVPDDWDGANVYFEIDWFPDSGATTGTDAIRWTVEYRAIAEGEAMNNGTSVTVDNGAGGDTGDYTQYQTKHTRFTLAYNSANQPLVKQDHIYFKISRDVGVANDWTGTVTVTAYEIIYTSIGFPTSN